MDFNLNKNIKEIILLEKVKKMKNTKEKIKRKDIKLFMGIAIITSVVGISGIAIETHTDHINKVCPFTRLEDCLGLDGDSHQIKAMERDYAKEGYKANIKYNPNYFAKYKIDYSVSSDVGKNILTGENEVIDEDCTYTETPIILLGDTEIPMPAEKISELDDGSILVKYRDSDKGLITTKTTKSLLTANNSQEVYIAYYTQNGIAKIRLLKKN